MMETLKLPHNYLKKLPPAIENLVNCTEIDLSGNGIGEFFRKKIYFFCAILLKDNSS